MSCRNAVLIAAASSKVSGGTKRVFVRPGAEALAMMAMPQVWPVADVPLDPFAPTIRCHPPKKSTKIESQQN